MYYDDDADLGLLTGKTVAIIGYGSQGHAHSLNLKDSGVDVVVGLREGSSSAEKARADGLEVLGIADAASRGDIVMVLLPDEKQAQVFEDEISDGMTELVRAGYETLVEAGYDPRLAYFECLHELKLIVDLMYEKGITGMRYSISNTAEYGDLTREWIAENRAGQENFRRMREEGANHQIEREGKQLRSMMDWIDTEFHAG